MSNPKEIWIKFRHLIPNKLLKQVSYFVENYYYLAELLIVENR